MHTPRSLRNAYVPCAAASLLTGVVLAVSACSSGDPVQPAPPDPVEFSFSFDEGMEGWAAAATDTLDPPIEWHVRHSTARARSGDGSVELHLENLNDAGKVWMERSVQLEAGVTYEVDLSYAFATSDWGDFNLFTVIAGVHAAPPRTADDLTFQDDTGHGGEEDVGFVWQDRSYSFSVTAPPDGVLHVAVGVWGTWETTRTYFVDDLTVVFTPREGG